MKKGWQTKQLGELCRFIDYRGKTPEKTASGLRLITAKNVKMGYLQENPLEFVAPESYDSWMTRGIPKMGDVLFTTEAPLANVAQLDTDEKVVFAQRIIVLQPAANNIDRTFLKYLLLSDVAQNRILEQGTGATVQGIKASLLKTIQIPVPPLAEQQRIVGLLDEAFAGLATAKANAEKNLQNARALFESHLQSVFTQRGPGWVEKRLVEVSREFGRGKSKHRPRNEPKLYDGPYPFIQTGDISNADHWLTDYTQTYSELGLAQSRLWPKGTICIAIVGATVGETAILDFESCFPDSVIGIVVNDELADNEYVEFLLQSFKALLKEKGKGTARDNINLGTFENQLFPFPALKKQKAIVATLNSLREETQRLARLSERKHAALAALKKSLLHQAFTGAL